MPQAEDNASPEDPHNPDSRHNRHKHGGTAPVMWRCTRYGALHPICGGAPEQKRCIAYGSGAVPQHTRTNAELAHRTTHRRTPSCAAGPYWWQDGHAAHATTCTPAHSDTSHTLTCEEPVYVRYSRLAHALAGSRASGTPCPRQFCPQRRPPRPRHPIVGVCRRGGLHCGRHTTPNRDLTAPNRDLTAAKRGGNCIIRATTRRRHADRMLLMVQNPHHYPWCHAPTLVSCSLTVVTLSHWCGAARRDTDKRRKGVTDRTVAGERATNSTTGLVPIRQNTPSVIIQRVLIGRNALDQVESSFTGRMSPNGSKAPDQESSSRWCASCLRRRGAGVRAQASSLDDARDRAATNTL